MDNIVSYVEKELAPADALPLSAVDSLVLSRFAYFRIPAAASDARGWEGMRITELFRADYFPDLFRYNYDPESAKRLLTAMAASPRFRDIRVCGYVEQTDPATEKQFAAMSFLIGGRICYVAFRGTDSTLVGWKEDFNMAFQCPVPAQISAAAYLSEAAAHCGGELLVGGHSKGGNLAVYAAAFCGEEVKRRITAVYSHDGPGFLPSVLESAEFASVSGRIDKTVPQSSLIGMLLEHQENYRVIKSNGFSVWQHDPFSWEVDGGSFSPVPGLTSNARYFDRVLNEWVSALTAAEREQLVDLLFGLVDTENVKTTAQLRTEWKQSLPTAFRAASDMSREDRDFITRIAKALVSLCVKNFPGIWRQSAAGEQGGGRPTEA